MVKIEVEKVTVEVPKAIMDFLRAQRLNPKEYIEYTVLHGFAGDLDASAHNGPFNQIESIAEHFHLDTVFKAHNLEGYC